MLEKARRVQENCGQNSVPLGAAAIQLPFGHPAISSVIPGPNAPEPVKGNVKWMRVEIPAELCGELKKSGLLRPDAATPKPEPDDLKGTRLGTRRDEEVRAMAQTAISIDGFSTATAMLQALRSREISAAELLELHVRRSERHNPAL